MQSLGCLQHLCHPSPYIISHSSGLFLKSLLMVSAIWSLLTHKIGRQKVLELVVCFLWMRPLFALLYRFSSSMVIEVLVGYRTLHQGLHFPAFLAVTWALCRGLGQWDGKEGAPPFIFLFLTGWNANVMAETGRVILDHTIKAPH